jgi:hypothetical protein
MAGIRCNVHFGMPRTRPLAYLQHSTTFKRPRIVVRASWCWNGCRVLVVVFIMPRHLEVEAHAWWLAQVMSVPSVDSGLVTRATVPPDKLSTATSDHRRSCYRVVGSIVQKSSIISAAAAFVLPHSLLTLCRYSRATPKSLEQKKASYHQVSADRGEFTHCRRRASHHFHV